MAYGQRVSATDEFGNYRKEVGTVVGFEKNAFGRDLIVVQLDSGGTTVFYPSELTRI